MKIYPLILSFSVSVTALYSFDLAYAHSENRCVNVVSATQPTDVVIGGLSAKESRGELSAEALYIRESSKFSLFLRENYEHSVDLKEAKSLLLRATDNQEIAIYKAKIAKITSRLVKGNQRLVKKVAHNYRGDLPFMDAIQAGNIGLLKGIDRFDPERAIDDKAKQILFAVFVKPWIMAEIRTEKNLMAGTIYRPLDFMRDINRMAKNAAIFASELEQNPSDQELSEIMTQLDLKDAEKYTPEKVAQWRAIYSDSEALSENKPSRGDDPDEVVSLLDLSEVVNELNPYDELSGLELSQSRADKLLFLKYTRRLVVGYRLGTIGYETLEFSDIGTILGVSGSRVEQLEKESRLIMLEYIDLEANDPSQYFVELAVRKVQLGMRKISPGQLPEMGRLCYTSVRSNFLRYPIWSPYSCANEEGVESLLP